MILPVGSMSDAGREVGNVLNCAFFVYVVYVKKSVSEFLTIGVDFGYVVDGDLSDFLSIEQKLAGAIFFESEAGLDAHGLV